MFLRSKTIAAIALFGLFSAPVYLPCADGRRRNASAGFIADSDGYNPACDNAGTSRT